VAGALGGPEHLLDVDVDGMLRTHRCPDGARFKVV
jgi:hypothetical protein